MTVTEQADIYRNITHLLSLDLFDHIHWQLDVLWSNRWRNFKAWSENSYKPGISRIVELWLHDALHGRFDGIAPIQGIIKRIVRGGVKPPCGSGQDACAISTDGRILACPVAVDVRWAQIGDLKSDRTPIPSKVNVVEPCTICEDFELCGGRCLYANMERFGDDEQFAAICDVTKHLITEVKTAASVLSNSLGYESLKAAAYPEYNNTIEIIP
jgi:putative peptide-modifying radical SAM enzyme